jgi:hypothetical protein
MRAWWHNGMVARYIMLRQEREACVLPPCLASR